PAGNRRVEWEGMAHVARRIWETGAGLQTGPPSTPREGVDAVMDLVADGALAPGEGLAVVAHRQAALLDQPVAQQDDDVLHGRARVVGLRHAVNGVFEPLDAVLSDVNDENLLATRDAVRCHTPHLTLVAEVPYHASSERAHFAHCVRKDRQACKRRGTQEMNGCRN